MALLKIPEPAWSSRSARCSSTSSRPCPACLSPRLPVFSRFPAALRPTWRSPSRGSAGNSATTSMNYEGKRRRRLRDQLRYASHSRRTQSRSHSIFKLLSLSKSSFFLSLCFPSFISNWDFQVLFSMSIDAHKWFFFFNFWVCARSGFVFLFYLFKTWLNPSSCDFLFLFLFLFFY